MVKGYPDLRQVLILEKYPSRNDRSTNEGRNEERCDVSTPGIECVYLILKLSMARKGRTGESLTSKHKDGV